MQEATTEDRGDVPTSAYITDLTASELETASRGAGCSTYPVPSSNRWSLYSTMTDYSCCATDRGISDTCQRNSDLFEHAAREFDLTLPNKSGWGVYRWLRWNFFSAYRRLFTVVFLVNMGVLVGTVCRDDHKTNDLLRSNSITATSVNIAVAIVVRNEHMVNILFLLSSSLPLSTPLFIRRWFAKIYAYGGIHSGCAMAAVVWYWLFTGLTAHYNWVPPYVDTPTTIISLLTSLTLLLISAFSIPRLRTYLHDWFESVHRFAGWLAIILFWCQTLLAAVNSDSPTATALLINPTFWCLLISTLCIVYPWTRLRRRDCVPEPLSNHAIRLGFEHDNVPYCSAVRIALNPLKDTHAFAAIPNRAGSRKGFCLIVSNAGDWTRSLVNNPPSQIFIKGGPLLGVLRVATMFRHVLIVATGSGIGPCLSLFHGVPSLNCRVLWSASAPLATYGQEIVDDVLKADPTAVIVDTAVEGRPNMERLTYALWKANDCEAVVVISNPQLTRSLVYGMETRGVPAYGPIFDS